uniref:acyltransferase family protein n=1 Tax=Herbaspirillum chlorophenolicum TaxID=211589 RepID=UPI0014717ED4
YTKSTVFPGIHALPVVAGALLVIGSGPTSLLGRVLALSPIRYVGKISYGFYLWHWPIFIAMQSHMTNSRKGPYLVIALVGVLSALTYHFVEQPIRERRVFVSARKLLQGYFLFYAAAGIVVCVALFTQLNYLRSEIVFGELGKVLNRIHQERSNYLERIDVAFNGSSDSYDLAKYAGVPCSLDEGNSPSRLDTCLKGALGEHAYLLIGDSIGRDTLFALRKAFPSKRFAMLHQSSCIPVDTYDKVIGKVCFQGLSSILAPLLSERRIDGIILASRIFPEQGPAFSEGVANLENTGIPLLVITGTPALISEIDHYVSDTYRARRQIPMAVEAANFSMIREGQWQAVPRLREGAPRVPMVDVYQYRCSSECPLFLDQNILRPIIFDREHLTLDGIDWFSQKLANDKTVLQFLK